MADATDAASLESMASQTKVVLSLSGPYAKYGTKAVAACIAHGTHWCDLTGTCPSGREPAHIPAYVSCIRTTCRAEVSMHLRAVLLQVFCVSDVCKPSMLRIAAPSHLQCKIVHDNSKGKCKVNAWYQSKQYLVLLVHSICSYFTCSINSSVAPDNVLNIMQMTQLSSPAGDSSAAYAQGSLAWHGQSGHPAPG